MITAKQAGAVTTIVHDYSGDDNVGLLFLTSDLHIDSVYCNRDALISDFEEAKRRNAMIFLLGDVFDAMQGRFDPRRSLDELRPEYRRNDYYDYVVKDVAKLLKPYAENIMLITPGNHETAVLKNASLSLIDRLVYAMNLEHGGHVLQGGYGGWVRINLHYGKNGHRTSIKMKYHHGFGGDAPVTRGVIHTNRQNVYIKDADIIVNGHNHNAYYVPIVSETLSNSGKVVFQTTHHIRTPGYKQEYGDGTQGWAVEKGMVPKPLGGAFVQYEVHQHGLSKGKPTNIYSDIRVMPLIHAPDISGL
jgi:hypothetical protein